MKKIVFAILIVAGLLFVGGCAMLQRDQPQLTNWEPTLSPDGRILAYASPGEEGFEVYIRNLETGETTRLTENDVNDWGPNWSPQGDRLVYTSNPEENVDLYVIDLVTLTIIRLTTDEAEDVNPHWADNDKILFNSNRSGAWEAYMIDPDGRNLTRLTETTPIE